MDTQELVAPRHCPPTRSPHGARPAAGDGRCVPQPPIEERERLRAAMSFDEDMVGVDELRRRPGALGRDARGRASLPARFDELPSQTDQLFVVDRDELLLGVLPLNRLIVSEPDAEVADVMQLPSSRLARMSRPPPARSTLRPRVGTCSGHQWQARRSRHCRRSARLRPPAAGRTCSPKPACARRGHLRVGVEVFQNRWTWLAVNLVTALSRRASSVFSKARSSGWWRLPR